MLVNDRIITAVAVDDRGKMMEKKLHMDDLALICSCFGFTFQPLAQKYLSAETAGDFHLDIILGSCYLKISLNG